MTEILKFIDDNIKITVEFILREGDVTINENGIKPSVVIKTIKHWNKLLEDMISMS